MRLAALVAVVLAFAVAALVRDAAPEASAQAGLTWRGCGGGFDCATLQVPLDYDRPGGETVGIAMVRLPATDSSRRIGSLFANPGGPGASGIQFVRAWAGSLSSEVRARFDIVGWDPRGIGESSPIVCHDTLGTLTSLDLAPDSEAEFEALARAQRAFNEACARNYPAILPHLGTRDVARDLDRMRAAVGDAGLTYVGYSYGTVIGQAYAQLFPRNVRALVLDGAVDLAQDADDRALVQAVGFERALASFVADCRARGCIEGYDDPARAIRDLLAKADAGPIPSRGANRPAREGEVFYGLITPLYQRSGWGLLGRAIEEALDGDGSRLVQLTDQYLDRRRDGTYANSFEANLAVNCLDQTASKLPVEWDAYRASAERFAAYSPTFGPSVASGLTCEGWAAEPEPLTAPTGYDGAPAVVISTTGDPATPYEWGAAVAVQMRASLITYGGEGHTVYTRDACVDDLVDAYLVRLELPPAGARCGAAVPIPAAALERPSATPATGLDPAPGGGATPPVNGAESPSSAVAAAESDGGSGAVWVFGVLAAVVAVFLVALIMGSTRRRRLPPA